MKVSVIIPCYNEQESITSLLEAIQNQDFPLDEIEVIISDGLSTEDHSDGTFTIQNGPETPTPSSTPGFGLIVSFITLILIPSMIIFFRKKARKGEW